MSRRMMLPTREMGPVTLLAVSERGGQWEEEWAPLRGTRFGDQFTVISRDTLNHALHGLSRPLVDALGIPPVGALRKLLPEHRVCYRRRTCPFYDEAQCFPTATKMPWCFEPDEVPDDLVRKTASKAIEEWRAGVYVCIVQET